MTESCSSCEGTGWLYTSSWDEEGFPCPKCSTPQPDYQQDADDTLGQVMNRIAGRRAGDQ